MEAPLEDAILQPPWRFIRGRVVVGRRPWAVPIGATLEIDGQLGCDNRMNLGFNSKHTNNKAIEQTDLHACRTPARLAFADHMHGLVAGDGAPSSPERPEILTGADPALDGPVILFEDVI